MAKPAHCHHEALIASLSPCGESGRDIVMWQVEKFLTAQRDPKYVAAETIARLAPMLEQAMKTLSEAPR